MPEHCNGQVQECKPKPRSTPKVVPGAAPAMARPGSADIYIYIYTHVFIPAIPHKAVAEVSE